MAAVSIHAALVAAAVSGAAKGPVLAVIAAFGDKGAHALAGFALVLPALLLLRGNLIPKLAIRGGWRWSRDVD